MSMVKYYEDNQYWQAHGLDDQEDANLKFDYTLPLLQRHNFNPKNIIDCGSGSGRVSALFHEHFNVTTMGIDLSTDSVEHARQTYQTPTLNYNCTNLSDISENEYDLGLMFDVFEHVPDYMGFLRTARNKAKHWLFHIPLDMSAMHLLDETYMSRRKRVGHLHYFTEKSALATLHDTGFTIIDKGFAGYQQINFKETSSIKQKIRLWPGVMTYKLNKELAVKLFGGASLVVFARSADTYN